MRAPSHRPGAARRSPVGPASTPPGRLPRLPESRPPQNRRASNGPLRGIRSILATEPRFGTNRARPEYRRFRRPGLSPHRELPSGRKGPESVPERGFMARIEQISCMEGRSTTPPPSIPTAGRAPPAAHRVSPSSPVRRAASSGKARRSLRQFAARHRPAKLAEGGAGSPRSKHRHAKGPRPDGRGPRQSASRSRGRALLRQG